MERVSLWRSTIGLKVVMAVTGIIMVAFLIGHLGGNLLVFFGPQAINDYAQALRIHYILLWTVRIGLIAAVLLHILSAALLTRRDLAARPVGYALRRPQASTWASRTMRLSGVLLALFIIFHLLHFATGVIRPAPFDAADVYDNIVNSFHVPWVVALYLVAMILVGLHLYHGIWAAIRTMGLSPSGSHPQRRPLGALVSIALWLGFTLIPLIIFARTGR